MRSDPKIEKLKKDLVSKKLSKVLHVSSCVLLVEVITFHIYILTIDGQADFASCRRFPMQPFKSYKFVDRWSLVIARPVDDKSARRLIVNKHVDWHRC